MLHSIELESFLPASLVSSCEDIDTLSDVSAYISERDYYDKLIRETDEDIQKDVTSLL